MALPTNKAGLLFTKIDSGRALRAAGDRVILGSRNSKSEQEWIIRQKISECGASVTEAVHACGGIVAQRAAEFVFATFPNARSALKAACEIRRQHRDEIRLAAENTNSAQLGLRLGLAYGKMLVDAGKLSGDAVSLAGQIARRASAGQVIAAESLVNALGEEVRGSVKSLGRASFDDVDGDTELFEVNWEAARKSPRAYAETVASIVPEPNVSEKLRVRFRGKEIVLDVAHPAVVLRSGQQKEPHARLEHRESTFFLVNFHPNGTRIRTEEGEEQLCLDECELTGEGAISLGSSFMEGSSDLLTFTRL